MMPALMKKQIFAVCAEFRKMLFINADESMFIIIICLLCENYLKSELT